jgi:hypothetical protein
MLVFKRIICRKTNNGYSICLFVKDPRIVKPLFFGLERFFDEWDKREVGQMCLDVKRWGLDEVVVAVGRADGCAADFDVSDGEEGVSYGSF